MSIDTLQMETQLEKARISDVFFNYAATSYIGVDWSKDKRTPEKIREDLIKDAVKYLDMIGVNADLPEYYTANSLVTDFLNRL